MQMEGPTHPPLGAGNQPPAFETSLVHLHSTDRLVLVTDGITARVVNVGGRFGTDGIRQAVHTATAPTAAATALAIQRAVTACCTDPLQDDATVVVLAVD